MSANNEIQYTLTINTEMAYSEIRKLEISFMRILGYIGRLSPGNESLQQLIKLMQSALVTIRSLQIAIHALEMASGPIGWLYAGTTVIGAGLSGYSMLESMTGA